MLGIIRPMVRAERLNSDRATSLGTKFVSAITSKMRFRFSSLTWAVPLMTRETVAGDTPASCATSRMLLMLIPPFSIFI